MSVCSYLGKKPGEVYVDGQVLAGGLSVEEARAVAARGAWRLGETYESAADYDPVLRSHCRLDERNKVTNNDD